MKKTCLAILLLILSASSVSSVDMPYCADTVYEIDLDQTTSLGFSPRDLLNLAGGTKYIDWTWDYREGSTKLVIRTANTTQTARYIDSVAVYPNGAPEVHIICPDRVEVDAWVTFATDDGAFNERWYSTIYDTDGTDCMNETGDPCYEPGTEAVFNHQFARQNLTGEFYKEVAVPEEVTVDFYAEVKFRALTTRANVYGQAHSCNDDVCYADYIHGGHTP